MCLGLLSYVENLHAMNIYSGVYVVQKTLIFLFTKLILMQFVVIRDSYT